LQANPEAQSEGSAHAALQALLPSQAYGVQSVAAGVHWPPALQVYAVNVDAAHVVGWQVVPAA
jgi:hypothetical protein